MSQPITVSVTMDAASFRRFRWFDLLQHNRIWKRALVFTAILLVFAGVCLTQLNTRHEAGLLAGVLALVALGLPAVYFWNCAHGIKIFIQKLGLDKDMYSVSIPLGATINMDGAAITITIMTLAAANTLGIPVTLPAAIVLSAMSALGACGASGVAGGSLLLIPMACSLFGISNDVAMQMVGVGFIIGVIQDSVETALNSAGDVEFAATAEYHQWLKQGKPLPDFLRK